MPVGTIGNSIFVNQMTPTVSSVQNNHTNRIDFQNMIAQASANEKDEKVLEVRPTEENHQLNPDREHQRQEADQETKMGKRKTQKQDDTTEEEEHFKLDIKV